MRAPRIFLPYPMRYQLAAFDFDGTLADTIGWFETIVDEVCERYGLNQPDADERERLRGCDAREALKRLNLPIWRLPAVLSHVRSRMAESGNGFELFPGIREALAVLHGSGLELAVLSSNADSNVRRVLGAETAALFQHYACGTDLFGKAGKLRTLLRRTGIAPEQVLLIGDEIRDIEAARQAGVAAAAVTWGYNRTAALQAQSPDLLIEHVNDLPRLILGTQSSP